MKTFEDYGVVLDTAPVTYDTDDPVELAVVTYSNLGLIADENKARDAFTREVNALQSVLPESVAIQPHDIVIVPRLGGLSLGNLIERYDVLTTRNGNPATYVWKHLWKQYSDEELNQGQTKPLEAKAVLLGGGNVYDEPGLYFTDQNLYTQRKSLEEAQKTHDNDQTTLSIVNIAGYIVRNAMRLERGDKLQDKSTTTRFIELDIKRIDGLTYVPSALSDADGKLVLLRGVHKYAFLREGTRLSVELKRP